MPSSRLRSSTARNAGDPAVGRGQLRALARQRAARATTVAEVHGQEAPDGDRLGGQRRATPPSERPWPRSAGRGQQGPGSRGAQRIFRAMAVPSSRASRPGGRAASAATPAPTSTAISSARPACSTVGAALRTGRHPTTVGQTDRALRAECAWSGKGPRAPRARESQPRGRRCGSRRGPAWPARRLCPGGSGGGWRRRSARRPGGWRCRRTRRAARPPSAPRTRPGGGAAPRDRQTG